MDETDPGLLWALRLSNQSEVLTGMIKTMHKHLRSTNIEMRQDGKEWSTISLRFTMDYCESHTDCAPLSCISETRLISTHVTNLLT